VIPAATRPLTFDDLPEALRLSRGEGWNQTEADWRRMIELDPGGALAVDADDGTLAGTLTAVRHGPSLGWIGMMLVDPRQRRKGIATALMNAGVAHLRALGVPTVKLDATEAGREVYRRMGFVDECAVTRCTAEFGQFHEQELVRATSLMLEADLEAAVAFDAEVSGVDRSNLLRLLQRGYPQGAFVHRAGAGAVDGYVMVRPGDRAWHIGPWIAAADDIALNLLYQALACVGTDQKLIVDVSTRCPTAAVILEPFGFRSVRTCTRMTLGPSGPTGKPECLYGLSGFETG